MKLLLTMILYEKYETKIVIGNDILKLSLYVLKERKNNGYYDCCLSFLKDADEAIINKDGKMAYKLLLSRSNYEYENFEFCAGKVID